MSEETPSFDSDTRFERTRGIIVAHLDAAIAACAQPREFHVLIRALERVREDAMGVTPGVRPDSLSARLRLYPWRSLLKTEWRAVFSFAIATIGGLIWFISSLKELLNALKLASSLDLISPAFAAGASAHGANPTVLLIFQVIIMGMVPLLALGAFYAMLFGSTPMSRRAGKDLVFALAGFIIGAATSYFLPA
jgi:hypothetical protein